MTRESIDELRERLLRDERVLDMIRMRAYEIYQMRGETPGHEAEDWFRAEVEVIGFIIDQEPGAASESAQPIESSAVSAGAPTPEQGVGEGLAEGATAEKKTKRGASARATTPRKKKSSGGTMSGSEEVGEKKKAGKRATDGKSVEGKAKEGKSRPS
jgi:hypothetical protein